MHADAETSIHAGMSTVTGDIITAKIPVGYSVGTNHIPSIMQVTMNALCRYRSNGAAWDR